MHTCTNTITLAHTHTPTHAHTTTHAHIHTRAHTHSDSLGIEGQKGVEEAVNIARELALKGHPQSQVHHVVDVDVDGVVVDEDV